MANYGPVDSYDKNVLAPRLASSGIARWQDDPMLNPALPNYMGSAPATPPMPAYPAYVPGPSLDRSGLNAFRGSAMRQGASPWADMATAKSYVDQAGSQDSLRHTAMSDTATAQGNLAMRGGLRSGAAERVQTGGNRDAMNGQVELAKTGMSNRAQIGINDEQNRVTQLGMLPGMDLQASGFGQKESNNQNEYNLGQYNNLATTIAAGRTADATARAGGGSFLCDKVSTLHDDKGWGLEDARALLKFRRYAIRRNHPGVLFYLRQGDQLVKRMDKGKHDWLETLKFVRSIISTVERGDLDVALTWYAATVFSYMDKYWPECQDPAYTARKGA